MASTSNPLSTSVALIAVAPIFTGTFVAMRNELASLCVQIAATTRAVLLSLPLGYVRLNIHVTASTRAPMAPAAATALRETRSPLALALLLCLALSLLLLLALLATSCLTTAFGNRKTGLQGFKDARVGACRGLVGKGRWGLFVLIPRR